MLAAEGLAVWGVLSRAGTVGLGVMRVAPAAAVEVLAETVAGAVGTAELADWVDAVLMAAALMAAEVVTVAEAMAVAKGAAAKAVGVTAAVMVVGVTAAVAMVGVTVAATVVAMVAVKVVVRVGATVEAMGVVATAAAMAVATAAAMVAAMVGVTVAAVTAAVTVELHSPHQHSIVLRGSHHPHHKNTAPRCRHSQPRGSSLLLVEARKSTASQWKALDR